MFPNPLEESACLQHLGLGAAEFAFVSRRDFAAELRRHHLLAVADAEDGHSRVEERIRGARCVFIVDGGWAAREDHGFRRKFREGLGGALIGDDLAIDARLTDAAGDQLRHLRAEIDDQNLVVMQHNASVERILRHRQTYPWGQAVRLGDHSR